MSYNPSQNGPRGPQYDDYGIPDYPDRGAYRQQRPVHPPQGRRAPQQGYGPDPRMRFPHPQAYPRHAPQSTAQNLYDGSDYGEPEPDQWPLDARSMPQARAPMPQQPAARGGPPPRPQRPEYAPLDFEPPRQPPRVAPANRQYHQPPPPPPLPQQQQQQIHHGSGEWTGDGYAMPGSPPTALPPVQGQSLAQQAALNAPRRPPLGPPPSARRGPSSYYSQISSVHPIVEETDSMRGSIRNPSRASFASSNAIPIGIPDYYLNDRDSGAPSMVPTTPGSEYPPEESPIEPVPPLRMGGFGGPRDLPRDESPATPEREASPSFDTPVRHASLGKRSKPTLTTVKSGDKLRSKSIASLKDGLAGLPSQQKRGEEIPMVFQAPRNEYSEKDMEAGAAPAPPVYTPSNGSPTAPFPAGSDNEKNLTSGFYDSTSEKSSDPSVKKVPSKELLGASVPHSKQAQTRERSPLAPRADDDPRIKEILGGLERGGALEVGHADTLRPPTAGLSEQRAGKRRPARLNVDSVREAEARGSLTSLPDLIKRATKLASNLDRGRTASRLGMSEWLAGSNGNLAEKRRSDYRRSGASISDILASFPPPGVPTPPGSRQAERRSLTTWSSNLRHSELPSDSDAGGHSKTRGEKRQRRCCGMPLWLFLLLLALLFCLVAAAVIVPVVLVVVPNQDSGSSSTGAGIQSESVAQCASQLSCANGGQVIAAADDSCRCICVNGHTGSTCQTESQAGCTTISAGSTQDATIGNAIPRVLDGAQTNFSIPLDAQALLGLFSNADLSCSGENALVTFNGSAQKRGFESRDADLTPSPVVPRQASAVSSPAAAAVTSNGIVFESGSPPISPSASSASSSSSSSPSSTASSTTSEDHNPDATTLDFARTAVLYILQISGQLDYASSAQETLQQYFDSGTTGTGAAAQAANVSLGNGWSADLQTATLVSANGTSVGGTG